MPIGYMEHTKLTDDEMRSKAENAINPLYNEQVESFNQAAERNRQAAQHTKDMILKKLKHKSLQDNIDRWHLMIPTYGKVKHSYQC